MNKKTSLASYENRPVKRFAHSVALSYHQNIDTIVTLAGNSGYAVLAAYKPHCRNLILVEHDPKSFAKVDKEIKDFKKRSPNVLGSVRVYNDDLLNRLPRRKDSNLIDLDCEHTVIHPDTLTLLPAIKGRKFIFTSSFRGMKNLHDVPNKFLVAIGRKRSHGLIPLRKVYTVVNSSARFSFVKEYRFYDTSGQQYAYLTYRDGMYAALMTIITPIPG